MECSVPIRPISLPAQCLFHGLLPSTHSTFRRGRWGYAGRVSKDARASSPADPAEPAGSATERPTRVTVAAVLVALEGMALAVFGVLMLVLLLAGDKPDSVTQAVTGAVTMLVLALLPLGTARGLWRLSTWSRGPAIFLQVLGLPVGWQMASSEGAWFPAGLATAAVAIAALVCLFHPASHAVLGPDVRRAQSD